MKKRLIALLLVLAMVFSLVPAMTLTANAAEDPLTLIDDGEAVELIGSRLVIAIAQQPTYAAVLKSAADDMLAAIKANEAAKSEGIGMLGYGLMIAIAEQPTAATALTEAAATVVTAIQNTDAAKSSALGRLGYGLLIGIAVQPTAAATLTATAADMVTVIQNIDAAKSEGLGYIGSCLLESIGKQPTAASDLNAAADTFVTAIQNNDADKNRSLGVVGGKLLTFIAKAPAGAATLNTAAATVVTAIHDNAAEKSDAYIQVGGDLLNGIANQPAAATTLNEAANTVLTAIQNNDAAKSFGLSQVGGQLLSLIANKPTAATAFTEAAGTFLTAIQNNDAAKSEPLGMLGASLLNAIYRQTDYVSDLNTAAGTVLTAIQDNPAEKSTALFALGKGLLTAIARTPTAAATLNTAATTVITAIQNNDAAKSVGLGTLGNALMAAIARAPDNASDLNTAANTFITAIQNNDATKSKGLGALGAESISAIASKPDDAASLTAVAQTFITAIQNNDAAKSYGLGMLGGSNVQALAKMPGAAAELTAAAQTVSTAIQNTEAAKSNGLGYLGAGLMGGIDSQPEAATALNAAAGTVITAIQNNPAQISEALGKLGNVLMGTIARMPDAAAELNAAAGTVMTAMQNNPDYFENICNVGTDLLDAIASQPEAAETLTAAANDMLDGILLATCTVGEQQYFTLQAGLNAAAEGATSLDTAKTVKLIANVTENVTLPSGKFAKIDLNGHVLKAKNTAESIITNIGTLALLDNATANNTHWFKVDADGLWVLDDTLSAANYTFDAVNGLQTAADGKASADIPAENQVIKVTGGCVTGGKDCWGSGIYNSGNLTVSGGNIIGNKGVADPNNNYPAYGCGIYNEGGTLNMTGGTVAGNVAIGNPGKEYDNCGTGVFLWGGSFTLDGGRIEFNTNDLDYDSGDNYGFGGGVCIYGGSFIMKSGSVSFNSAVYGGGIDNENGMVTVSGGSIENNRAAYAGGGIRVLTDADHSVTISGGTVIKGNSAELGGGIYDDFYDDAATEGRLYISDCTITENSAYWGGGMNIGGHVEIKDSVITGNTVTAEGTRKTSFGGAGIDWCVGTLTLSGKVVITDNLTNGEQDNLFMEFYEDDLTDNTPVIIGQGGLSAGSEIGITHYVSPAVSGAIPVTDSDTDVKYFTSDENDYYIKRDADILKLAVATVKIAKGIENGKIAVDDQGAAVDTLVTVTASPTRGYVLEKLTVTDKNGDEVAVTGTKFTMPSDASKLPVTVNATFVECCKYAAPLAADPKAQTLLLGGEQAGEYIITGSSCKGYTLQDANGKYVAFKDGTVEPASDAAFTWKYDGGLYAETKTTTKTGFWFWKRCTTTVTRYYLSVDGTDFVLSGSKVTAEIEVMADEHTYKYLHDGDGKHEAVCVKCGLYELPEAHDYTYDKENHKCICGKLDPKQCYVSDVKVTEKATRSCVNKWWFGWCHKPVTRYQYSICAETQNVCVAKIAYSLDGETGWQTGNCFTSCSKLSEFYIRVTDSNGVDTDWLYKDGKVTQIAESFQITYTEETTGDIVSEIASLPTSIKAGETLVFEVELGVNRFLKFKVNGEQFGYTGESEGGYDFGNEYGKAHYSQSGNTFTVTLKDITGDLTVSTYES